MKLFKKIITIIILPIYILLKLLLLIFFKFIDFGYELGRPIIEGVQTITEKIIDDYKNLYNKLFKENRSGG